MPKYATRTIRRRADEQGVAMITAIIVSAVVLTLSITAVSIAFHNATGTASDRSRVLAVHAAEAGIDRAIHDIQYGGTLPCNISQTVGTSTNSRATATVAITYYASNDTTGAALACPPASANSAKFISKGVTGDVASVERSFEVRTRMVPVTGINAFQAAVATTNGITLPAATVILGNGANNADIISGGDITCNTGGVIQGSVYSQGGININTACLIQGDVWGVGDVNLTAVGTEVARDVRSRDGHVDFGPLPGVYLVGNDVCAGTNIDTVVGVLIGGQSTAPSNNCGTPPGPNIPVINKPWCQTGTDCTAAIPVGADWVADGWDYVEFTSPTACTQARDWMYGDASAVNNLGASVNANTVTKKTILLVHPSSPCLIDLSKTTTANLCMYVQYTKAAGRVTDVRITNDNPCPATGTAPYADDLGGLRGWHKAIDYHPTIAANSNIRMEHDIAIATTGGVNIGKALDLQQAATSLPTVTAPPCAALCRQQLSQPVPRRTQRGPRFVGHFVDRNPRRRPERPCAERPGRSDWRCDPRHRDPGPRCPLA